MIVSTIGKIISKNYDNYKYFDIFFLKYDDVVKFFNNDNLTISVALEATEKILSEKNCTKLQQQSNTRALV